MKGYESLRVFWGCLNQDLLDSVGLQDGGDRGCVGVDACEGMRDCESLRVFGGLSESGFAGFLLDLRDGGGWGGVGVDA